MPQAVAALCRHYEHKASGRAMLMTMVIIAAIASGNVKWVAPQRLTTVFQENTQTPRSVAAFSSSSRAKFNPWSNPYLILQLPEQNTNLPNFILLYTRLAHHFLPHSPGRTSHILRSRPRAPRPCPPLQQHPCNNTPATTPLQQHLCKTLPFTPFISF